MQSNKMKLKIECFSVWTGLGAEQQDEPGVGRQNGARLPHHPRVHFASAGGQ